MPNNVSAIKPGFSTITEIVLEEDGEFDVLQEAVVRVGLADALNGKSQLTVFAPTDEAFIKSLNATDEGDAISIIKNIPLEDLTSILLFHVIEGRRNEKSVVGAPQYRTIGGNVLTRDQLLEAGIKDTNISARNGIIHVINSVLIP